jgi:hypothetical protein
MKDNQRFRIGDVIKMVDKPEQRALTLFPRMAMLKGKLMTIKSITHDQRLSFCTVFENTWRWDLNWFRIMKTGKGRKPKFRLGDWVILKESINSPIGPENTFSLILRQEMLIWKNRFMKINYTNTKKEGSMYHVHENYLSWLEDWLEKVE